MIMLDSIPSHCSFFPPHRLRAFVTPHSHSPYSHSNSHCVTGFSLPTHCVTGFSLPTHARDLAYKFQQQVCVMFLPYTTCMPTLTGKYPFRRGNNNVDDPDRQRPHDDDRSMTTGNDCVMTAPRQWHADHMQPRPHAATCGDTTLARIHHHPHQHQGWFSTPSQHRRQLTT
ncbi:uncharacterized protein LACBIDRAFT_298691 [Laccaria bicolor S238N-H82]|uniref:Predicted protein n=1 Tax=Laccaria bicolor (strain S238N-H82 / ATCC MYA-4686) TaxID=486041 RepID=B0DDF3_LACBS|nr:uncharacterized protein LACBIDRAFT_298691 [Laccaria bicolor S238N-H82]EDR07466.1 predicted protein [Laccaria bicolor S238N-H82]|eukprot:XP_001881858.1 predicted protein [Laccaria bicolor S238N-H82]